MKAKTTIAALGLALLAAGCGDGGVSDSTRAERKDLAFSVAGKYVEDAAAGVPSALTIRDESGVSDIAATLELRGGLRPDDRAALEAALRKDDGRLKDAEVGALAAQIEASLVSLTLGEGKTFSERGGENIATDHAGDLAEIALRRTVNDVGVANGGIYRVTVSLFLTGHRGVARLDSLPTAYTDDDGRGAKGVKGLLLTVSRGQDGATRDVATELALTLGALLKI